MNERIAETISEVERFMATVDDALALPRQSAEFLRASVLAAGARRVVEIGTSYGYSGLWIAAALCELHGGAGDGRLITIDHLQRKSDAARAYFSAAGLEALVDVRTGEAFEVLRDIDGPIDFVFNDADKDRCIEYVDILTPHLRTGAVVLTDNTDTHAEALRPFLDGIRDHPKFASVNVPIGSGMELSVRVDR